MRVSVGDVWLFFEVFGRELAFTGSTMERRPALIGLHGGPGLDGTKLRHQLAPLAEVAQVVVPDQRGHGRSDRAGPESWNLASWAADVKSFSDALGIERPVVLGVSFGGFVAQESAPGRASPGWTRLSSGSARSDERKPPTSSGGTGNRRARRPRRNGAASALR